MASDFVTTTVRCAATGCNEIKGSANHWYACYVVDGTFCCEAFTDVLLKDPTIKIHPACGQVCAGKLFNDFLSRKKLKEP